MFLFVKSLFVFWCPCMAINVSVQYHTCITVGFSPTLVVVSVAPVVQLLTSKPADHIGT